MNFRHILYVVAVCALTVAGSVSLCDAKGGGFSGRSSMSFGSARTSGTIRSMTPATRSVPMHTIEPAPRIESAPSIRVAPKPSVPQIPLNRVSPDAAQPAAPVTRPALKPLNFSNSYQRFGYTPTVRQSSFLESPWFWLYMMSGHSTAAEAKPVTAAANPAMSQQQFEQNCRTAAMQADKPADLDVQADDCPELARLAYAKVQAEAADPMETKAIDTPLPEPEQQVADPIVRDEGGSSLIWWIIGIVIVAGTLKLVFSGRRPSR